MKETERGARGHRESRGAMLRGLFQRKPKHERLEEEPEVRFKGLLVSEKDLGYTYIRPGGKWAAVHHLVMRKKIKNKAKRMWQIWMQAMILFYYDQSAVH